MQRVVRGKQARRALARRVVQTEHATVIQASWRRKQEAHTLRGRKEARRRHERETRAAVKVQAHARRWRSVTHVLPRRRREQRETVRLRAVQQNRRVHNAATFVQSYYRGHLSRRLMTIYFVAAIRVQRWFISLKSKRLWSSLRLDVPTIVRAEKLWR